MGERKFWPARDPDYCQDMGREAGAQEETAKEAQEVSMADETIIEAVRRERAEALARDAELSGGQRVEILDSGSGCMPVRVIEGDRVVSTGIVCGVRAPRKRCSFCKGWSAAQCDYPIGGKCKTCKGEGRVHPDWVKKIQDRGAEVPEGARSYLCDTCAGTGRAMCNKRICGRCRAHREPDEDYCPDHRVAAGFKLRRELCGWQTEVMVISRACLHRGCPALIEFGARVLFFPGRNRAMCESCGEEYLKITE
ncbi:MAG: hypothetical protein L0229_22475 [Blastocatellia bacterium]|nr:hypothetical protein [Blastocatellia bacterium]